MVGSGGEIRLRVAIVTPIANGRRGEGCSAGTAAISTCVPRRVLSDSRPMVRNQAESPGGGYRLGVRPPRAGSVNCRRLLLCRPRRSLPVSEPTRVSKCRNAGIRRKLARRPRWSRWSRSSARVLGEPTPRNRAVVRTFVGRSLPVASQRAPPAASHCRIVWWCADQACQTASAQARTATA